MMEDRQAMVYRHSTHLIFAMVQSFVPEACRREAMAAIYDAVERDGLELTSRMMRLEYEAWKKTIIDLGGQNVVLEHPQAGAAEPSTVAASGDGESGHR